jgi:hypothetical protein
MSNQTLNTTFKAILFYLRTLSRLKPLISRRQRDPSVFLELKIKN